MPSGVTPPEVRLKFALAILVALVLAPSVGAQEDFPTNKTVELKEYGKVWSLEGRHHVARNVKITNLRASTIEGQGEEPAVLVVDGPFKMKAVTGGVIRFHNVWLEVGPHCKDIVLSHVEFTGKGGLRSSPEHPGKADFFMEFVNFKGAASFSLAQTDGKVNIQASSFSTPLIAKGVPRSEKAASKMVLQIQACKKTNQEPRGLLGGIICEGLKEVLIRNCDVAGKESRFTNCVKLDFDGNNTRSGVTLFEQSAYGKFKKTEIHNCDIRSEVAFKCPTKDGKAERVIFEFCWFRAGEEEERIFAELIRDNRRDPEIGVMAKIGKTSPIPLGLGG